MQETEKIWMNGELVDWADAKVHVGVHGLHYGTGVFEGIRCYDTPKGPAVFRLDEHLQRLHNSAKLLYMELPYSVDELKAACNEVIGANGLPECYLRPIAFYGYGELGVAARGNPVEVVIMSWPWAPYLGEESLEDGHPREDLVLAARLAERRPARRRRRPASTSTRCSPSPRRTTPATTRRSCSRPEGTVADGSGENIFIVRDGVIYTPDLATGILPGITRDTIKQIAQDLGYTVVEKSIIRSDLYLADEVFMCGTAAEVTPLRSIDDYEIGVGEVTLQIQKAYLDTVRGQSERWAQWLDPVPQHGPLVSVSTATDRINLSAPWIDERDEELVLEVLRSGWLSLGPTGPRFESLLADAVGAPYCAAVSSGTAGLHLCMRLAGVGPGDEVITSPYSFVASANCAIYEGATPVFADIDPHTYNLDPAAVEAAITPRTKALVAVDIFGYPAEYDELIPLCEQHGIALVEDSCEALGATYKGKPLGSHGHPAVWAFYPNKQMTTGEGGAVTTGSEERARAARLAAQPGPARDVELAPARPARLQLPPRRPLGGARDRPAREARPHPRRRGARSRRATASCSRGVDVETPLADDADHVRSWFVYVVKLPRRRRPRRRDGAAGGAGDRHGAVPAVDPPAVVHARAVRVLGGDAAR